MTSDELSFLKKHRRVTKFPGPYFGNKTKIVSKVWERFGNVDTAVDLCCGTGSFIFRRPLSHFANGNRKEVLNDINAFLVNFFRAVQHDPEGVAKYANNPVHELDLISRYRYLAFYEKRKFVRQFRDDPEFYDVKRAGYFIWGLCGWIGLTEFMSLEGNNFHKLPEMTAMKGVNKIEKVNWASNKLWTVDQKSDKVFTQMTAIANRLRYVMTSCGSWKRVIKSQSFIDKGTFGIFGDPPYPETYNKDASCRPTYGGMKQTGEQIRDEMLDRLGTIGSQKNVRIAICGYSGDGYEVLVEKKGWDEMAWTATGGYANQGKEETRKNRFKERIWFSPHCLKPSRGLF